MPQRCDRPTKRTRSQGAHQPFRRNAIGGLLSKQTSQIRQAPAGIARLQQRLGTFNLQTIDGPLRSLALLNLAATLFALGMATTSRSWLQRTLWAILMVWSVAQLISAVRLRQEHLKRCR